MRATKSWGKRAFSDSLLGLTAILALGLGLRLYMSAEAFYSTFDTSTVGLMAIHILDGEFPLFYYGQNYMGALEAYVAAVMFSFFGVSTFSLSLSPIFFSLGWIFATYLLFSNLYGKRGGIAAALCVAVPGWYGFWFSTGSYGGYSVFYFLGTLFIYLTLLAERSLKHHTLWPLSIGMGCVFALGVWTNLQILSYLATGCLLLLTLLVRHRFNRKLLFPFSIAATIGLSGFIPFLLSLKHCVFGSGTMESPSVKYILGNLSIMIDTLPKVMPWPTHNATISGLMATTCLIPPLFLYLIILATKEITKACKLYIPVIFCMVFLVLLLSHPMASLGEPRYLIPMLTMLTCATFASAVSYDNKKIAAVGWLLLTIWISFNIHGTLTTAIKKNTAKKHITAARDTVVSNAQKAGCKQVIILGSEIDGNRGQSFSFHAKDQIQFVSSWDERYEPASQLTELNPMPGFLCQTQHLKKVRRSFKLAGVQSIQVERGKWNLLHHPVLRRSARKSILPEKVTSRGKEWRNTSPLFDRDIDTIEKSNKKGEKITIKMDFGRRLLFDSLWVLPGKDQSLPDRYEVEISQDGKEYTHLAGRVDQTALPVYSIKGRLYAMGKYDRMDLDGDGVMCRYIQLEMARSRAKAVLSELVIFEKLQQPSPNIEHEIAAIHNYASQKDIQFIIADRWLSVRLEEETRIKGRGPRVYPLYNARFKRTLLDRCIIPDIGFCYAVPGELADETEAYLATILPGADISRQNFSTYSLLEITHMEMTPPDKVSALYWNGHILTQSRECQSP